MQTVIMTWLENSLFGIPNTIVTPYEKNKCVHFYYEFTNYYKKGEW